MTEMNTRRGRIILGAGGVSALLVVLLSILNKPAYSSVALAAVMWFSASLSMLVLGVTFIFIRRFFETTLALLVAALLFVKAILVAFPLFIVFEESIAFMVALRHFRNGVDLLFLLSTAWVAYCGRKVLGNVFAGLIAGAFTLAATGLLANYLYLRQSGTFPVFLTWVTIVSTLLGVAGLGAGFIWLAFRQSD